MELRLLNLDCTLCSEPNASAGARRPIAPTGGSTVARRGTNTSGSTPCTVTGETVAFDETTTSWGAHARAGAAQELPL